MKMENSANPFEPLIERSLKYGQSSMAIIKLKAVDKTADITSTVLSRLFLLTTVSLLALSLNIAVGFWLGDLLGKVYFGFLLVAGFYALLALVLAALHTRIKSGLYNSLIRQMLR